MRGERRSDLLVSFWFMFGMLFVGLTMGGAADLAERWYRGSSVIVTSAAGSGNEAATRQASGAPGAREDVRELRTAPLRGPSDFEVREAAERAVMARFATATGYKTHASVSQLKVVDRKRQANEGWLIDVDMAVREVADDPQNDPRPRGMRHRFLMGEPKNPAPAVLNVVWSGQSWSVAGIID